MDLDIIFFLDQMNILFSNSSKKLYIFAEKKSICLGTSNIRRHVPTLKKNFPGCKFVLTYTLDELENKIHLIQDENDVMIHVLNNDVKNLCKSTFKSATAKETMK